MQFPKQVLGVVAMGLALTACNSVDFKKTKGGMPYKVFSSEKGDSVKVGSIIKFTYKQMLEDSVMVPQPGQAATPFYFQVEPGSQPYDISEVFTSLKEGDSLYAVQLVDTFMARMAKNPQAPPLPPQFKKGGKIITTLRIVDVFGSVAEAQADEAKSRQEAFKNDKGIQQQLASDVQALQGYLAQNNINAQKVGNGTFVQVLNAGAGPKVENGKFVSLMYKGQTLAGKVFDSNMDNQFNHTDPLVFQVGTGGMIRGFEEGVMAMSQGTKARLYIPSALAYGVNPPQGGPIGPNENLIFDVEVIGVSNTPPTPNRPASPSNEPAGR